MTNVLSPNFTFQFGVFQFIVLVFRSVTLLHLKIARQKLLAGEENQRPNN